MHLFTKNFKTILVLCKPTYDEKKMRRICTNYEFTKFTYIKGNFLIYVGYFDLLLVNSTELIFHINILFNIFSSNEYSIRYHIHYLEHDDSGLNLKFLYFIQKKFR